MGAVLSLVKQFLNTVWDLFFAWNKCQVEGCGCEHYSDESFFMRLRERAHLPTYGEEVIKSGKLGKPMRCDVCHCLREKHEKLDRRLLQPEMIPDGGNVLNLILHQKAERRRQERSKRLNVHAETIEDETKQTMSKQREQELVIEDSADVKQERTRLVCVGDKISFQFKMFKSQHPPSSPSFSFNAPSAKVEDGGSLTVTVGARNVIEGLDRGLVGTSQENRRYIGVPASMAYGKEDMVFIVDQVVFLSN